MRQKIFYQLLISVKGYDDDEDEDDNIDGSAPHELKVKEHPDNTQLEEL